MATFNGSASDDTLIGAANDADLFIFGYANLSANHTVTGGAGLAPDILRLTTSGDITAQLLAHKSGLEPITLSATRNSVTLDQVFLTANGQNYGNDTGNLLTITSTASQVVTYRAVDGGDTVRGGLGGETVEASRQVFGRGRRYAAADRRDRAGRHAERRRRAGFLAADGGRGLGHLQLCRV